ncbi:unnamed protein product [Rotaria sp. Silwood2]|nr:unnamed protein product [Rotaria sp. Silwood2]CAF4118845.1 unnamed protein product [Rotaria sp. Silwood2]
MAEACKIGRIFVSATGSIGLIRDEHIMEMRDMAILCNISTGQTEIDVVWLKANKKLTEQIIYCHKHNNFIDVEIKLFNEELKTIERYSQQFIRFKNSKRFNNIYQ